MATFAYRPEADVTRLSWLLSLCGAARGAGSGRCSRNSLAIWSMRTDCGRCCCSDEPSYVNGIELSADGDQMQV